MTARAVATLHRIAADWPGGRVLAVTHGALIRLVEGHLGSASTVLPNLAGRWVVVDAGTLVLGDRVEPLGAQAPSTPGAR